jgi:hypothetical protein
MWVGAATLFILLIWVTVRRFVGMIKPQWWAVPYSLITVSPCAVLYCNPTFNIFLVLAGVLVLQLPAMLWRTNRGE